MASLTMKTTITGTPLAMQKAFSKPNLTRSMPVVRASAEDTSRRAAVFGSLAGAAMFIGSSAMAIDIVDSRAVKKTGYDIIYEARDLDLPQSTRDGIDQYRGSIQDTKSRVAVSINRLKETVPGYIDKEYWTLGREELRLQLGTLRFDLDTIASAAGDKASKRAAIKAANDFFAEIEELDGAMRAKDKDKASKAFQIAINALQSVNIG